MKASFENSVSVLVRAYMNGTLYACDCTKCAIGNLVAWANNLKSKKDFYRHPSWIGRVLMLGWEPYYTVLHFHRPESNNHPHIKATGYTSAQLLRIEDAFMDHADLYDGDNFNGLMAVVDVLADIHGVDLSVKETAIGQFKEVQALKLV